MAARREDINDDDVRHMYEVEGMVQEEIADYYGVSQSTIYSRLHPDRNKENSKQWWLEHPDYRKDYDKEYYQDNREEILERVSKYRQTENGKASVRKMNDNRRSLGSIELNKPFPNSEGHHIDEEHIIHIPKELHRSISHNVWTGWNMEAINAIAFGYITEEMFDKLIEEISREVKRKKEVL